MTIPRSDGFEVSVQYTAQQVSDALGVPLVPVEIDGADLLAKIFED